MKMFLLNLTIIKLHYKRLLLLYDINVTYLFCAYRIKYELFILCVYVYINVIYYPTNLKKNIKLS